MSTKTDERVVVEPFMGPDGAVYPRGVVVEADAEILVTHGRFFGPAEPRPWTCCAGFISGDGGRRVVFRIGQSGTDEDAARWPHFFIKSDSIGTDREELRQLGIAKTDNALARRRAASPEGKREAKEHAERVKAERRRALDVAEREAAEATGRLEAAKARLGRRR